jgi:hypothetical protein
MIVKYDDILMAVLKKALKFYLKAASDFLLTDSRNSDDFFKGSWDTFLPTSDVKTGCNQE